MANYIIFTPCDNRRYEKCANYIINDFNNPKCANCLHSHQYKDIKNIALEKVISAARELDKNTYIDHDTEEAICPIPKLAEDLYQALCDLDAVASNPKIKNNFIRGKPRQANF